MNNLQPPLPKRLFPRSWASNRAWSWAALLASILICVMVGWLYLRQSELSAIELSMAAILLAGICTALILAEQARKNGDTALSKSELRFRSIFDHNVVPMGIYAPSGEILNANAALLDLVGYTTAEMKTGQILWDAITPDEYRQRDLQAVREVQQQGFCAPYEKAFRHKDGHLVPILIGGGIFDEQTGTGVFYAVDLTERKRAELALRESEERLALVMEGSQLGYWDWNIQTGEVHRNALWAEMLGYTLEEIELNVTQWTDLHHPDDRAAAWKSIQDHLDGKTPAHRIEYRMRMKDGRYKWILDQARVVQHAPDGKPLRMSGTHTDITERVQAQEKVRVALAKYQTLFDSFPLGITVADKAGTIVETNHVAEQLLGLAAEEQNQREIDGSEWHIVNPDGTPMPNEEFPSVRALHAGCKVENVEMGILNPHGDTTWINVTAAPLPLEDYGVVVTYSDITERKNMQQQLQENERNYRELVQNANSAIIRYKRSGEVSFFNEFAQTLFGYPAEEIVGKPVSILLPATDSAGVDLSALVENIIDHPEEYASVTNQNICRDGRRVWMTWTNQPIYDPEVRVTEILTVGTDITELKRTEDELRRSNAELEQFAYVASHDLQEPLRTVAGMMQMLQKRYGGQLDARADEYIHFAVDATDRMQQLINDLLDFSRIERRGRPFAETNMEKVLQIALANLKMAVAESDAKITHDPLPTVMADSGQLTQVLQNLIGNAIKFRSEQPPEIHISAEKIEHGWQFAVQDNGIGIDPEYFERIFLIFQRLHTRKEYPGTGIGLALCKRIIERHGGEIWIESELKHGTTFYFTLPSSF